MPATDTAPTMTPAQLRAGGTRLLGFYLGGGGVKVDALVDTSHLVAKDAAGVFIAAGPLKVGEGAAGNTAKLLVNTVAGTAAGIQLYQDGTESWIMENVAGGTALRWVQSGTERMRLAGNGRLGVGASNPQARADLADLNPVRGIVAVVRNASGSGQTGCQLEFTQAAIANWAIGQPAGVDAFSFFAGRSTGSDGAEIMRITSAAIGPASDNNRTGGTASLRYSALYAATGTINTCDVRSKFYRAEPAPTADEHAAALECFAVFGFFQHLDAREREGNGGAPARWHFGPKAQEVWAIFATHGLAAPLGVDGLPPEGSVPPAFLCFDAWGEEVAPVMAWWRPSEILGGDGKPVMVPCAEGEEGTEQRPTGETYVTREAGNIFGVRIDQLQSLMIAALNAERVAQEARLAALEAAS